MKSQSNKSSFFSPAKLNLFFKVLGKRRDGYHEIESLFQAIDLYDVITVREAPEDDLSFIGETIPLGFDNIVFRALLLFRQKTGLKTKFTIFIEKNIPCQAGLGGGSSNAATILFAINRIAGNIASEEELQSWSSEIGSDIPFFFSHGRALCFGRGEIVKDVPNEPFSATIIKLKKGLSTESVYKNYKFSKPHEDEYFNDLEESAFSLFPELKEIKALLLNSGFKHVVMTGSGSSLFCVGEGCLPKIDARFFRVRAIAREKGRWYCE